MAFSGTQITRLGLIAIPRGLYGSFAGKSAVPANTLTSSAMKNNTGTVLANETGMLVYVYSRTDGTIAGARSTSQTTDGSGIWTRTDATNYTSATEFLVVFELSDGTSFGLELLTAT